MRINLSPILLAAPLELERAGDVLTINGAAYDFTDLPEGATLPRAAVGCEWLASDVERIDGTLHLTLRLPHGPNAPHETRFPEPIIDPPDGPVALPIYSAPQEDAPAATSRLAVADPAVSTDGFAIKVSSDGATWHDALPIYDMPEEAQDDD